MKRSERFKRYSNRAFLYAAIWFFLTIAFASFGWAYRDSQIGALLGLAVLSTFATIFWIGEGFNKRRLYKAERRHEISMAIRNNIESL